MLDKYSDSSAFAMSKSSTTQMTGSGWNCAKEEEEEARLSADVQAAFDGPEDRRDNPRHRAVMRAARLSSCVHKVEGMGIVRNISEGGMLVHGQLNFEVGEKVVISLLDGDRIEGEIIWKNGNAFGVQFCSRISVETVLTKSQQGPGELRPRPPRLTINRSILLRCGSNLADARLCDMSQRGAKIQLAKNLQINCRVQIVIGEQRPVSGCVKWQMRDLIGIEFHRTLRIEELACWTG